MLFRKVIHMPAECSPNVRLGLAQERVGMPITDEEVVPGVLSYAEYKHRLATWDERRIEVGIRARFYKGKELYLFPEEHLDRAERRAREVQALVRRATAMGIDTAEGGDSTCWAIVDQYGLLELISMKTPDTNVIPGRTLALMREHGLTTTPGRVAFDRGGGGQQHADRLRAQGYDVRTVGFGESVQLELKRGYGAYRSYGERREQKEDRYVYKNRRAELFGELSLALDPAYNQKGFALPLGSEALERLRAQLAKIPKDYDEEGRLMLRPKHRKPGQEETALKTLTELIGHSPDEADALALAWWALTHEPKRVVAGAAR